MSRPIPLLLALACVAGLIALYELAGEARNLRPPPPGPRLGAPRDLVIISVDTLRADRIGAYGDRDAATPNVDRLAREGIRFEQAVAPIPRTTPALASMLTGLAPAKHGSLEVGQPFGDLPTLAQVLRARGFATLAVSANRAASGRQGFDRGFDRFVDRAGLPRDRRRATAARVTEAAAGLLAEVDPERPLFLWVHYLDPHFPYRPPAGREEPSDASLCRQLRKVDRGAVMANIGNVSARALEDCRAAYDAEVAYVDEQVGRLLEALEAAGRGERTLVAFTADHGENMGEDGYWYDHGPSVHDASLRVPLILAGAGSVPGRVEGEIASLVDLAPTLLSMLGVPREDWPEMDGQDLSWRWNPDTPPPLHPRDVRVGESASSLIAHAAQFLVSGRHDARHCYNGDRYSLCVDPATGRRTFHDRRSDPMLLRPMEPPPPEADALREAAELWQPEAARTRYARTSAFKLVERPRLRGGYDRALYDLRSDPAEARDVSALHPDLVARLAEALGPERPLGAHERSREDVEALETLGYLE